MFVPEWCGACGGGFGFFPLFCFGVCFFFLFSPVLEEVGKEGFKKKNVSDLLIVLCASGNESLSAENKQGKL